MIEFKFQNVRFFSSGTRFVVECRDGRKLRFVNPAEAREIFLNEIDGKIRKKINQAIEAEGYNVYTGKKLS